MVTIVTMLLRARPSDRLHPLAVSHHPMSHARETLRTRTSFIFSWSMDAGTASAIAQLRQRS
jgi:hypothetical protein